MSLKKTFASGIKWISVSQVGRQVILWVTVAILARLLSPSDFGLMSMATVVTGFALLFKDLGTSAAVIQRRDVSESLLSSIFWVNVAFGFLVAFFLWALSPLIASFYGEPRLIMLLQVLSITFIISSLSVMQQAILQRNMAFQTIAIIELVAVILGALVSIGFAWLGAGVWSLVYQTLAINGITTALLWLFTDWKPTKFFCWAEVKLVSSYSLNLTGFNIFNYFARNADYLLVGRFLGAEELGYYTLAYRIMLYPLQNISFALGRVMFPLYSQIQEDDTRFRRAYLRVASAIALITFPMMIGLWGVAEPFVLTFFDAKWKPVILLLIILSPVGMMQSIGTTVGWIYQAKGRTDWMFRWGIGAGILTIIAFAVGLRWGIVGVAIAYTIISIVLFYPSLAIPFRLISLQVREIAMTLWRPLASALLMLLALFVIKSILPARLSSNLVLGILVLGGSAAYLVASWLLNLGQLRQALDMVETMIGARQWSLKS